MAKSVSTPTNQQSVKTFCFFVLVQGSDVLFDVSGFVPKAQIFALEIRLKNKALTFQTQRTKQFLTFAIRGRTPFNFENGTLVNKLNNNSIIGWGAFPLDC